MPFPSYEGASGGGRVIDVGQPRRRRVRIALLAVALAVLFSVTVLIGWYVEALWFASLGFSSVFWGTLTFKTAVFAAFAGATFLLVGGALWLLRPRRLEGRTVLINGQPITLSLGPLVTVAMWVTALVVAVVSGSTMMEGWTTFALFWHQPAAAALAPAPPDPIFGRPVAFYLFALPVWQALTTWATTLVLIVLVAAVVVLM
ncbi:MAG: UPF0182 family protein, partial [Acidobacteria bacterium]|nr:UPF0182 family protein [Acidobacteriota bacterium]